MPVVVESRMLLALSWVEIIIQAGDCKGKPQPLQDTLQGLPLVGALFSAGSGACKNLCLCVLIVWLVEWSSGVVQRPPQVLLPLGPLRWGSCTGLHQMLCVPSLGLLILCYSLNSVYAY